MPLTGNPLLNLLQLKSIYAFLRAAVDINDISAPVSTQAPIGWPLFNLTRLYYNSKHLGGVTEIAEATACLLLPFGMVVSLKY